jgi:60 kDa SS-A/Ro ribonucleoprotein
MADPSAELADLGTTAGSVVTLEVAPDETRLHRFLTLGTADGTYASSEPGLTAASAPLVVAWARDHPRELVDLAVTVSAAGRAPTQRPAIFALAAAAALGDDQGRAYALTHLGDLVRTGSQLFCFASYVEQFRGWGRGLRRAIASWYTERDLDDLAYQLAKYRQRDGWTHRDLLRLSHPVTTDPERRALFDWACGRAPATAWPPLVQAYEYAQVKSTANEWVLLIGRAPDIAWDMLPDSALVHPDVWAALVRAGVPQSALVRQLPRLTRLGLLAPESPLLDIVTGQLRDVGRTRAARIHPLDLLVAASTYASGHSAKGDGEWTPVPQIIDALDTAFYTAFDVVEPTGRRMLLALDVSASMAATAAGLALSCREASAALALVTATVEPHSRIVAFTAAPDGLTELTISPRQRLDDVVHAIAALPAGPTDCALPILAAIEQQLAIDVFVVYTGNATSTGAISARAALAEYRRTSGIDARLVVVAMRATALTIADPDDPGMLDITGFDSSVARVIGDFASGAL